MVTTVPAGTTNWDVPLNAALNDLQGQITQLGPTASITVDQLTSTNPFFIAHRGSGGEFPEHTLVAFNSIAAAGAQAIEVSTHLSADGVLFCLHDNDLNRMTNGTWTTNPELWTWAALNQRAKIVGTPLLGPGWADQSIPTAKEVFDRFLGQVVIFAESKTNGATPALQQLLLTYPGASQSVVWKGYYTSNSFVWARSHSFKVWAYTDAATTMAQMDAVESSVDFWGVPWEATDAQFQAVVARPAGLPVISWEVHRRSEVQRLQSLGVRGIMCSQWLYCTATTASMTTTNPWFAQVKSPGEIGAAHSDPNFALKWDTTAGNNVVYAPATSGTSVLMGAWCPTAAGATGYKIAFDMMWPVLPTGTLHAGLYFGEADDSKHQFGVANAQGCYRMLLRPNAGTMQLYTVAAGAASGVQVGTDVTTSGVLVAATWYSYEIEVNATSVVLRRTDSTGWSGTFATTAFRGGYFGIHNGSLTDVTTIPRYRNLKVTAF